LDDPNMNHLSAILNAYQNAPVNDRGEIFLATIVHTQGSTYRKSGARMLIAQHSNIQPSDVTGMVSGGCLEQDILCHIQQQTPPYFPFVITYDTTTAEDIIWGFGLGCEGVVQILVERLAVDRSCNPLTFIADCFDRQQPGILATVFQVEGFQIEGQVPVSIGARLMVHPDGIIASNLENPELEQAIAQDAQIVLQQQRTIHRQYALPFGQVQVLLELIQPPTPLIVFGAGRDAFPLAQFAKALGWHLTLVDCRSLETTGDRFAMADQIILTRREIVHQQVAIAEKTIAVVMTHNYHDDLAILTMLLASPAQYIGVLGSRQRTERLFQTLQPQMTTCDDRLHAPIGLDIGAETPEEIAIAIMAEIQAVLKARSANFLKHRPISSHQPNPARSSHQLTYASF
jgi:xanthine/CO dehydrogenase XdhC/CoxF family maturation factor